jgi:DNA-binding GntR family transcriptional regulator
VPKTVQPIQRGGVASSAREQTYAALRNAIVDLRLTPGARLSDVDVAAELKVSRTPVREALLRLADDGLVDVLPQAGTFVARISITAVREAQFVREALEVASLAGATVPLARDQHEALHASLAGQREAAAANNGEAFYDLDQSFHRTLIGLSGFPGVWRVADRSRAHLNRVRRLSLPETTPLTELVDAHAAILQHLDDGERDAAVRELRRHLRLVLENLPPLVQRHPDFFDDAAGAGA